MPLPLESSRTPWGLLIVCVVFGLPLLAGLGRWDMGSDEAIYSYAVERILETGDWLTPRSIPNDLPFFEKPPLKFWMVAGAMQAGILPPSDAGMRVLDAVFGVASFGYVYLLGVRLAGPVCGIVAGLILFAFSPLLFEHGLRSNNMEASLVLAYCGGIFHFVRWAGGSQGRRRQVDALLVALYFVLGFMTKFVAAAFLPVILGMSLLLRPGGCRMVRQRWREWAGPLGLALGLIAPWFVYQSVQPEGGRLFWEILIGVHVYQRLAGVLDPNHLAPWYYYLTATWRELGPWPTQLLVHAGIGCLVYLAVGRRAGASALPDLQADEQQRTAGPERGESSRWLARVVLLWWLLPYAAMSLGTSKLLHYAYPFLAPLALGGGLACALALQATGSRASTSPLARLRHRLRARLTWADGPRAQALLLAAGVLLWGLSLWTAVQGPVLVEIGDVRVFRNGSVARPIVFGMLCIGLTRRGRRMGISAAMAALLLLLPVDRYVENVRRVFTVAHPLRAIRDCAVDVQQASPELPRGTLWASGDLLHHSYYYYMRHAGEWIVVDPPSNEQALAEALGLERPMPVFVTAAQYAGLARGRDSGPRAVFVEPAVVALLPGPFETCVPHAIAAGARPVEP
jgi:4-amino-4-deoxy-L-arabinose transferase-like glycosyltransferase